MDAAGFDKAIEVASELSKKWEELRLAAYPDPCSPLGRWRAAHPGEADPERFHLERDGAPWTCGWGATGKDIGPTTRWTTAEADRRHLSDVSASVEWAARWADRYPKLVPELPPPCVGALADLEYNVGADALLTSGPHHSLSHLLLALVRGDYDLVADQFLVWDHARGKVVEGLLERRKDEARVWCDALGFELAALK